MTVASGELGGVREVLERVLQWDSQAGSRVGFAGKDPSFVGIDGLDFPCAPAMHPGPPVVLH